MFFFINASITIDNISANLEDNELENKFDFIILLF